MSISDKREVIVRAALKLIVENGFHGAPMSMIAQRANVGTGTIYRYFDNKDVLITDLYKDMEEKIYLTLLEGYDPERLIWERFSHIGTVLLRFFIDNPINFRYIEQFYNSPYGVAIRREHIMGKKGEHKIDRMLFEDGVSQQVIKDLPLTILFNLGFGSILAVARDHILGFITLDDALVTRAVEACWDAIKR
ncbi:MAG: TetR/AcrR family transcriptional regulator [Desulfuromonadaceae bacterium]|nr:TetR/AcrR family transcriptional regulator [Desulfuromonadaceae bacterium]